MRDLTQLAFKQETTPGTAIAVAAADVLVRIREGDSPNFEVDPVETQEVQAYSSSRPVRPGKRLFRGSASWVLRPGSAPDTVAPSCGPLLVNGLLKQEQLKQIAIGSITNPPYRDGDEIEGVTSGAKGIVFRDHSVGPLKYYATTGTMISGEVIRKTGGGSVPQATSSGSPTNKGFLYHLVDSDFTGGSDSKHHGTVRMIRGSGANGYFVEGRGVLGELAFEFKNNEHAIARASMVGPISAFGDVATFDLASYPDDGIVEPRFVAASLTLGGYAPTDLVDLNLSIPLNLEVREDANDTSDNGLRFCDYDRRGNPPLLTIEPAMVSAATYDFFTKYKDGTTFAATWKLGSNFEFFADECQIVSAGFGSSRNLATVPLKLRLCGKKNNELYLWQHA